MSHLICLVFWKSIWRDPVVNFTQIYRRYNITHVPLLVAWYCSLWNYRFNMVRKKLLKFVPKLLSRVYEIYRHRMCSASTSIIMTYVRSINHTAIHSTMLMLMETLLRYVLSILWMFRLFNVTMCLISWLIFQTWCLLCFITPCQIHANNLSVWFVLEYDCWIWVRGQQWMGFCCVNFCVCKLNIFHNGLALLSVKIKGQLDNKSALL